MTATGVALQGSEDYAVEGLAIGAIDAVRGLDRDAVIGKQHFECVVAHADGISRNAARSSV